MDPGVYVDYRGPIVSTNAAYRKNFRGGFYMSAEGKAFKNAIALHARRAMSGRSLIEGPVSVMVDFWFKTHANDVDGPLKLVLDSLQGHVYPNDRQVVHVSAAKHKADEDRQVGFSLTVKAIPNEENP
jgi:Holliday junction resolvase RusA-like endonuclease